MLDDGSDAVFAFAVWSPCSASSPAGFVAGPGPPATAHRCLHGAAAAFAGFVVAQAIAAVLQVVRDEDLSPVAIVFNPRCSPPASANWAAGWRAGSPGARAIDMSDSILVVDVGTSSVRGAIVRPDATVEHVHHLPALPDSPPPAWSSSTPSPWPTPPSSAPGRRWRTGGPVGAVGITNQRASTVVWDRATGEPVGPGLGWQDLRTVGDCLVPPGRGHPHRPQPVGHQGPPPPRPGRPRPRARPGMRHGRHVAGVAPHRRRAPRHRPLQPRRHRACAQQRRQRVGRRSSLAALRIPASSAADASSTPRAHRRRGPRSCRRPPIAGIAGDQQASLLGQACTPAGPGQDHLRHRRDARRRRRPRPPGLRAQGGDGCFPIIARRPRRR